MASSNDNVSMALFCDFENVALGVRDANYDKFDIKPVLERLLLKGSIVVKKAYCDWDRYKAFKAPMHEANFELIEIPHVRQSGKNSADIRMVVDALDLCYTKSHVDTFVIISGDSDFSPLVSKLRENAKKVIGVGVKQSTSDLLVANCDEFIFYDDLVRESRRAAAKRDPREGSAAPKRTPEEESKRRADMDRRRSEAVDIAVGTFDALVSERGDSGKIWASVLKEAIKRRKPDFSESYYGFRTFGNLLEEAQTRGLLEFGRDEKSGAYVYRSSGAVATPVVDANAETEQQAVAVDAATTPEEHQREGGRRESRRNGRGGRKQNDHRRNEAAPQPAVPVAELEAPAVAFEQYQEAPQLEVAPEVAEAPAVADEGNAKRGTRRNGRGGRKNGDAGRDAGREARAAVVETVAEVVAPAPDPVPVIEVSSEPVAEAKPKAKPRTPARKVAAAKKPAKKAAEAVVEAAPVIEVAPVEVPVAEDKPAKAPRKAAPRRPARKKAEAA